MRSLNLHIRMTALMAYLSSVLGIVVLLLFIYAAYVTGVYVQEHGLKQLIHVVWEGESAVSTSKQEVTVQPTIDNGSSK